MTTRVAALDYAFAVGRVRALENYLIPYQVFREAAEAESAERARELISDSGRFGEDLLLVGNADQLDRVLLKERMALDFNLEELFLEKPLYHAYQAAENPSEMSGRLETVENHFIRDYFRLRLDLANLKLFLRCRYLELPEDQLAGKFLPGGRLDKKLFLENYRADFGEFYQLLRSSQFGELWKLATEHLVSRESLIVLERETENLSLNYLKRARQITFGPEPLFAYGLARRHELKLVRIVLAGKFLQLPASFLRERISQTYV
ncbi:MAG: V-type ATPase subunit [Candidatus Saccharicenans sp.]|nr:V-type ATPase subunit [Candidatus Saccharicenans sp.]